MTDIDRQLMIMDLEHDFQVVMQDSAEAYEPPEWWYIGMGLVEAPDAIKAKAREIYLQFLTFKSCKQGASFEDLIKAFTLAKTQNRS